MERLTNQKQVILEYLQSMHTHPTADEVFSEVRKKLPRISLGTVYRNLENFCEKGLAVKLEGEIKRFDGDTSNHHHFLCKECHNFFDVIEKDFNINKILKKAEKIGKIKISRICVYGTCKKCRENR